MANNFGWITIWDVILSGWLHDDGPSDITFILTIIYTRVTAVIAKEHTNKFFLHFELKRSENMTN